MNVVKIPLRARPHSLEVILSGAAYQLNLYWLEPAQVWVLDIADNTAAPLARGLPLVTGVDLLSQFDIGIPGQLLVISDHEIDAPPGFGELEITGHLYYVTGA